MKQRRIALVVGVFLAFFGVSSGQDYVSEPLAPSDFQAKWAIGWDAGRLLRGQAVVTAERWFHPEFSLQAVAGTLVTEPIWGWPVLGSDLAPSALESGTTWGMGVRFHPTPAPGAPVRAFVGFAVNRDQFTIRQGTAQNVWVHQEIRALIGATKSLGEHWALTGHVAVNATNDRLARRTLSTGVEAISAPGRVAGIQVAYRW